MKKITRIFVFACSLFPVPCSLVFADVPVAINYVGHLGGEAMKGDEQVMLMVFRLYGGPGTGNALEKKTALWGRQASVSLKDGNFDVDLKDTLGSAIADTKYNSLAEAVAAAFESGSSDLYLGLTPASDQNAEIFPRQRLTAIPKAVQARAVRTIPNNFTAPQLSFEEGGSMQVTGASQFGDGTTYRSAQFEPGSRTSFKTGVDVAGTLKADQVAARTVKADSVSVGSMQTTGTATLDVTGTASFAGATKWSGDFKGASSTTAAVTRVVGDVWAKQVKTDVLTSDNFINNSSSPTNQFYRHESTWRILGAWRELKQEALTVSVERHAINVYDAATKTSLSRNGLTLGSWQAESDCLAYFQVSVLNRKDGDVACVQFYIVPDPNFESFTSVEANGAAVLSNGNGGTLKNAVPLLLRKNQIVKWVTYNNNKASGSTIEETGDTKVTAIRWVPFGW